MNDTIFFFNVTVMGGFFFNQRHLFFSILASIQHSSASTDADDPMSSFTSILKDKVF